MWRGGEREAHFFRCGMIPNYARTAVDTLVFSIPEFFGHGMYAAPCFIAPHRSRGFLLLVHWTTAVIIA